MGDWKACVGKMSDREIARRFGIGASSVGRYRYSLGIPEFHPEDSELPAELIEQLATRTNYQLAQEFGASIKHWIKKIKIVAPLPHDSGAPERTKRNAKLSQPWPSEPKGQVSANKNCRSPLYLRSRAS